MFLFSPVLQRVFDVLFLVCDLAVGLLLVSFGFGCLLHGNKRGKKNTLVSVDFKRV